MAQPSRVFRVFISSTFTDPKAERDALQERVFPKLRDHCAEKHYSFQAIDLRWGIGEEASAGRRTMRICLDEVARCQDVTPRPNFLVLLGDRYGWRPLPEVVDADEFERVMAKLSDEDREVTEQRAYYRDDNAVPAAFVLAPVGAGEPYDSDALRVALEAAARASGLDGDALAKYTASATEQEVPLKGALRVGDAEKHVFCFLRSLSGLPESVPAFDPHASQFSAADPVFFSDYIPDGSLDTDAAEHLAVLNSRLREKLGEHVFGYDAQWTDTGISTGHIDRLCSDMLESLMSVIDAEIDRLGEGQTTTRTEEDAAHEAFREERGSSFTGREEYLSAIGNYVSSPASHPLVVWGYGGSGKSALLAKAIEGARAARRATADPPGAILLHRFIGATPKSADVRSLLQDLFDAIGAAYQLEGEMPSDFNELVRAFRERLEAAGSKRPLLLFIDSLDQLSTTYGTQGFTWLPTDLPEGVWIIASIRAEEADEAPDTQATGTAGAGAMSGPLGMLQRTLPESALLELGPMSRSDAEKLLAEWLASAGRTLQDGQRAAVLDSFERYDPIEHRGLPLHLRLAFGRARTWRSDDKPEGIRDKVRDMVAALYEYLEREHGPLLVGHTLAYLSATRNTMGLAEDEILDLFSAEIAADATPSLTPAQKDWVLAEFNQRTRPEHRPPDGALPAKLPVVVWSRLYFDLAPYLGTRSSEGVALLAFYHRELGEVATKRYLAGARTERHATLATMFEKMADPKADRSWAGSPRALAELPYHLTGAEDWDGVFKVLTDFTFLEQTALKVGVVERPDSSEGTLYTGVYALLDDYEHALAAPFPKE